jgi:hypothetical protein
VDNESINDAIDYLKSLNAKIEGGKLIEPVNCSGLLLIALPQQVFSELASVLTKDATCTWQVGDKCLALVDAGVVGAFNLAHEPVELTCQNPPCTVRVLTPEWFLYDSLKLAKVGDYYVICYNNNCAKTDMTDIHGTLGRLNVPREIAVRVEDDVLTNAPWGVQVGEFSDGFNEYPVFRKKDRLYIRLVRTVERDGEEVEDVREGDLYRGFLNALVVRDELTNMQYYILRTQYGTYVGFNPGEAIEALFTEHDPGIANTRRQWVERGLELLFRRALDGGVVDTSVYSGPYPDGWRDGFIDYPVVTWDCDPTVLEELIKFILDNYDLNRRQALANVGLFLGSVYAPALKFHWGVFENRIVINTGPRWVGKTTDILAIMNALGVRGRFFSTDEVVRTVQRLRNILAYSMAPVVFNDVDTGAFESLRNYGVASTTDATITGVQAASAGRGFREVFLAVSNIFITTNLPIGEVASALSGGKGRRDAWLRRVLFITWEAQRLKPGVHAPRFDDHAGRLIGCLRQLWEDPSVRDDLLHSSDFLELSAKATKYFFIKYGVNVGPIIEALAFIKNEHGEVVDAIEATTTPERRAVQNMIEIAKKLGYQADALGVITALVNSPTAFDARPGLGRQVDLTEWEWLVRWLGRDPQRFPLTPDDRRNADRVDLLLDMLRDLYQRGIARFIFYANSPEGVVRGKPRTLFGSEVGPYPDNDGKKRRGYSVSLVELVRQLLAIQPMVEEAQEQGQGQEQGGGQEQGEG